MTVSRGIYYEWDHSAACCFVPAIALGPRSATKSVSVSGLWNWIRLWCDQRLSNGDRTYPLLYRRLEALLSRPISISVELAKEHALLILCSAILSTAQTPFTMPPQGSSPALTSHPEWPKANPADVATIEDIIRAFYSAISDRTRLRSSFPPAGVERAAMRIVNSFEEINSVPRTIWFPRCYRGSCLLTSSFGSLLSRQVFFAPILPVRIAVHVQGASAIR